MADQEEDVKRVETKEINLEQPINKEDAEEKEDLTTLFAVRTTINQESNILKQIFYRFKILDVIPDIRAMLVSPLLPGYIFFEAPLKHVLLPRSVTEYLEEGDTVEIISGVFEGSRALVMRMPHDSSASEEVVVRLLQEETPITIKIHGDYLKLVEKKQPVIEPIPQVKVSADTTTDMEKAISFEDELEDFEEEVTEGIKSDVVEEYTDDEEEEEEDEWAKFDGF